MKKTEAISILATSVRPREPKDRARYDEAVKMAIEALRCSETPKSSERTVETAQNVKDGDSVFRQAAIDALKGLPTWWADEGGYYGGAQPPMVALLDPEDAVSAIENLPSAQPATNCSEIPNGSDDTISRQAALDAIMGQPPEPHYPSWYAAQIEKLPAVQPEQRWIPVEERLPAVPWCRCLITRDDGRGGVTVKEALFSFGRWYDNEWLEDGRNRKFNISESVIAWAPFPAPYRGGEQDDR